MDAQLINYEIKILGVAHGVQNDTMLKWRRKELEKKGFEPDFIARENENILHVRKRMLEEIQSYNPDLVAEECGVWITTPGDKLKKLLHGEKTLLEERYSRKHFFVDRKRGLLTRFYRFLKIPEKIRQWLPGYPTDRLREKSIAHSIAELIQNKRAQKSLLVVGGYHLARVEKLLKKKGFSVITANLEGERNFGV